MKNDKHISRLIPMYCIVVCGLILIALVGSMAATVMTENSPLTERHCVIIDAGHGGVDGGATSCTGVLESVINLEIALRLNDLMHLLGIDTLMIRTTDQSIHTAGESIAAKKVSDLKQRVKIVNSTTNGILISIHQNYFSDSRYSGAQVFYAPTNGSNALAKSLQSVLVKSLNPGSNRKAKKASNVYLMEKVNCAGVLIECVFLSNPQEASKLLDHTYQKNLCSAIATTLVNFINKNDVA